MSDDTARPESDAEKISTEEDVEEAPPQNVFIIDTAPKGPKFRAVSLFGSLGEEELVEAIQTLVALKEACDEEKARADDGSPAPAPLKFYISTWGGRRTRNVRHL